jgi:hypothetical protein
MNRLEKLNNKPGFVSHHRCLGERLGWSLNGCFVRSDKTECQDWQEMKNQSLAKNHEMGLLIQFNRPSPSGDITIELDLPE